MAQAYRDALERTVQELKSRRDEKRLHAAENLLHEVEAAHRELSAAQFTPYYVEVNKRIAELIQNGADTHERIGGLYALSQLIDFKGDDAAQKTTRFHTVLRKVMSGNDTAAMVVAAKTLG
ncbi:hypothetical protein KCV01_g28006, partial [Aureobasidium melanogenum]